MSLFGNQINGELGKQEAPSASSHTPLFHASNKNSMPATVIAKGVRLEGEFKSQGDVLIEGEVLGNIQTDGLLTAGPESFIKAGVTAADAVIAGRIEGNLNIKKKLEIKATAKIKGDTVCQIVVVEGGAKLEGNIRSGEETKGQANTATSKEPEKTPSV